MAIGSGVNKRIAYKVEGTFGTLPGPTGAQIVPRVTSDLNLVKNTYDSQEITSSFQDVDFRHGTRRVEGTLNGELHPGVYEHFLQSALRRDWTTGPTTGALTTISAVAGPPGRFDRSSGSFLTDGFRVGMVIRVSGFTTPGDVNNATNYRVTAVSALQLTVAGTVAAKTSGDTVTISAPGSVTYVPTTGHTNDSYTIEEWHSDVSVSRQFKGCRINTVELGLPATGLATCAFGVLGQDMETDTVEYYTTPTAAPTTGIFAAVSGALRIEGTDVATLTGLTLSLDGGMSTLDVVGSNTTPDVFVGRVRLTGQVTAAFESTTLLDLFLNETEAELWAYLTLTSAANSDFLSVYLGRVKFNGASLNDGEQALIQTLPIKALLDTAGTGYHETTVLLQDSTIS